MGPRGERRSTAKLRRRLTSIGAEGKGEESTFRTLFSSLALLRAPMSWREEGTEVSFSKLDRRERSAVIVELLGESNLAEHSQSL